MRLLPLLLPVSALALLNACSEDTRRDAGPSPSPSQPPTATPTPSAPPVTPEPTPTPFDPAAGAWTPDFAMPGFLGFSASRVNTLLRDPDGNLIAMGHFRHVTAARAASVARRVDGRWEQVGDGIAWWVEGGAIAPDGTLYAVGYEVAGEAVTGKVSRWSGDKWEPLAANAEGWVLTAEIMPDGSVLVGGSFVSIEGQPLSAIARYTEAEGFKPVGAAPGPFAAGAEIHDILPTGDESFCVVGTFDALGGQPAGHAACWDGAAWSPLGELPGTATQIIKTQGGSFVAVGTFNFLIDPLNDVWQAGIARFVEGAWQPFEGRGVDGGFINNVRTVVEAPNGDLYFGGEFGAVGVYVAGSAPGTPARNIARYDTEGRWHAMGLGLEGRMGVYLPSVAGVYDIELDGEGVLVAGLFSHGMTSPEVEAVCLNLQRFNAGVWHPTTAVPAIGGLSGPTEALLRASDGRLYAGGTFDHAATRRSPGLARLGANGWEPLDAEYGRVAAFLELPDGTILAGGHLGMADGTRAAVVAVTDDGLAPWGPQLDGEVNAMLLAADGTVYVTGRFEQAGGVVLNNVARLEPGGREWSALGDGLRGGLAMGLALAETPDGAILVGGQFQLAGDVASAGVARWDGAAWSGFGAGMVGRVDAITFWRGDLVIGGAFDPTGGDDGGGGIGTFDEPPTGAEEIPPALLRWTGEAFEPFAGGLRGIYIPRVHAVAHLGDGLLVVGAFHTAGEGEAAVSGVGNVAYFDGTRWHGFNGGTDDLVEAIALTPDGFYVAGTFHRLEDGATAAMNLARWRVDDGIGTTSLP